MSSKLEIKLRVAQAIYLMRKLSGASQADLGRVLEMTQVQVSKFETGKTVPTILQWATFCSEYNFPLTAIMSESDFCEALDKLGFVAAEAILLRRSSSFRRLRKIAA